MSATTNRAGALGAAPASDEERLAQLGYQQELQRRLSGFSNFAVSFSIISILAGAITSYGIAMTAGGPMAITLGWLFVGIMVTLVALAMAEVCSAYPTAGGALLVGRRAGQAQQGRLGLVRRLVQLPRRGRGHRGDRLRRRDHHLGVPQPGLRHGGHRRPHLPGLPGHHRRARPAQHVRRQPGPDALRHQRLVAPGRRRGHRGRAGGRAGPAQADLRGVLRGARTRPGSPSPGRASTRC